MSEFVSEPEVLALSESMSESDVMETSLSESEVTEWSMCSLSSIFLRAETMTSSSKSSFYGYYKRFIPGFIPSKSQFRACAKYKSTHIYSR